MQTSKKLQLKATRGLTEVYGEDTYLLRENRDLFETLPVTCEERGGCERASLGSPRRG
jgi:hypothetical protein